MAVFILIGCNQPQTLKTDKIGYSSRIFQTEIDQYGYEITKDDAVIIHQSIVPGRPGNKGFQSERDAKAVAKLVIAKLDGGIMPPSVSIKELDSLKIVLQ